MAVRDTDPDKVVPLAQRRLARSAIRYAPFSIPRIRRLQTVATLLWGSLMFTNMAFFFFICSFPRLWPILIAYLSWICIFDYAPERGGRSSDRIRKARFWKYFAGYFPISLISTCELPPDRTYIFGSHPHGIIGVGAMANFASDATSFSTTFPGIRPHLLTLATNFQLPFYRDLLLALGICSVSRRSCQNILRQGPGSSITIVIGGAAESLSARPGTADLTLRKRLGFIKLAIREGADLVPTFSFGENDIFSQLDNHRGTRLRTIQKRFQKAFGFTLPIFFGRGIFNYSLGMMPYRHPIVSVVGRPIRITKCANPSQEMLADVQRKYIDELMWIWDNYKDLYASSRKKELSIVD